MQLSYAQNLEDYHLSLLFADCPQGVYIDIGGGHPVADNVSFWFYLKGWRGLVVEPQQPLADLYRHLRPRDAIETCLVGRADGEADFHIIERLHGFSTTVETHAAGAKQFGAGYETVRRRVRTLAGLAAAHRLDAIDFLKIDVEGAEADVLAGADWSRLRPRVVVVEAIAPGSMQEAHGAWEHLITAHRYHFAYFDGLNRFYVAEEAGALATRFPRAKTPWEQTRHLYEFACAPDNAEHPDHQLARALVAGFLAAVPTLPTPLLAELLRRAPAVAEAERQSPPTLSGLLHGAADYPGPITATNLTLEALLATDRVRAALGRIAAPYDGGQLLD